MVNEEQASARIEEALDRVHESWDRLMVTMSRAPVADYAIKTDDNEWTPLDHMAHVTAWERSRRSWLLGRPRHEGLGVSGVDFELGYDALNEIVRAQTADREYQQIMDNAVAGHKQMLDAIASFGVTARTDAEGITEDEVARLGDLLVEHLANHYDEHQEYIEKILAR